MTILLLASGFALKLMGYPNADLLLYVACLILMVYIVFYYYTHKMGGL